MTAIQIVLRILRQHWVSTAITSVSIALAGGLWMAVWSIRGQANATFRSTDMGFDAVLGARGSPLQLTLNSIFHLEASPGNIGFDDYERFRNNPAVSKAIPLAVGDNLFGFRIVGTVPEFFSEHEYREGERFRMRRGGEVFEANKREAVLGSYVAQSLGYKRGSTFKPFHGLEYNENETHDDEYKVVGVLRPTNTPADRVVWIPLMGVQRMDGHAAASADEISAVLIQLKSPTAGMRMSTTINKQGDRMTFAFPIAAIVAGMFDRISWFDRALLLVAAMVGVVAIGSILASVYNTMNERRRDVAIMRSLGARRTTIFGLITLECAAIGAIGALLAFVFYGALFSIVASMVRSQTGQINA